jgi:hypothetical protein
MPIRWTISRRREHAEAMGIGKIGYTDLQEFFASLAAKGAGSYRISFDLTLGELTLSRDDLSQVARILSDAGRKGRGGPVAMIVRTELTLDMAVLLKQRVGTGAFRVFTDSDAARAWLEGFGRTNGMPSIIRRWLPQAPREPGGARTTRTSAERPMDGRRGMG